jgi:hypothetical protein
VVLRGAPRPAQAAKLRPAMTDDEADLEGRAICATCIREEYLADAVGRDGDEAGCFYCKKTGKTISMGDFATRVDAALERRYRRTSNEPEGVDYMLAKEGLWVQDGDPIADVVAQMAEIDDEPAQDVVTILGERHYNFDEAAAGQQGPYDPEAQYEEAPVDDEKLQAQWEYFQRSLQTESRLFNREAYRTLNAIFAGLTEHRASDGKPILIAAGSKKDLKLLYRARVFQSLKALKDALARPDLELGPPPASLATPGRMNAHGIAVFYGATDAIAALAETRPPVGSQVLIGSFEIVRPLVILDIEALSRIGVAASPFDANSPDALAKAKFLESLAERIARPVLPDDAAFEYLVTQAIAEYLAGIGTPAIDGIIYPSVQAGDQRNVVLFHKAARVAEMDIPDGTEITASLSYVTEDGAEPDYTVHEETPAPGEVRDVRSRSIEEYLAIQEKERDRRVVALRLVTDSLAVHHVNGVTFEHQRFPVTRQRSEKRVTQIRARGMPKF